MGWLTSWKQQRRPLLGIEIAARELRLVRLRRNRRRVELDRVASEPLADGVLAAGRIVDRDAVADALQRLLGDEAGGGFRVATALAGDAVMVKRLVLPEGPARQWPARIRAEAAACIPFAPDEVNLDFHLLGLQDAGRDILLVAAKKDLVHALSEAFALAGLSVSIIDHEPLAVQNCYEFNYQPGADDAAVLFSVGAQLSHLTLLHGLEPRLIRAVGAGSRGGEGAPAGSAAERVAAIRLEIRKTLDFLGAQPELRAVYLAGDADALPGLAAALAEEFEAPVETLDPFRRFEAEAQAGGGMPAAAQTERGRFAAAAGLALRAWAVS